MYRTLLFIGLGGFIGSVARYLTTIFLTRLMPATFPYGTFTVNILGCLAVGIVYGLADRQGWLTQEWRLFLATGICGGYTTFSAFAYENVRFLQSGDYRAFAVYSAASFALGLIAVFAGLWMTR